MGICQELSQARALLLVRWVNHFKSSRFKHRAGPEVTSVHPVRELHSLASDLGWKEAAFSSLPAAPSPALSERGSHRGSGHSAEQSGAVSQEARFSQRLLALTRPNDFM